MPARSATIRARGTAAAWIAALAAAAAVAGCGSSDETRGLSSAERGRLVQKLSEVRRAAAARDRGAAEIALDEFVDEVGALQLQGTLDAQTASVLLTGAVRARRRVAVEVRPPPAPEPPRRQPADEERDEKRGPQQGRGDDDDDDGGKPGKGRGREGEDGEDD